MSASVSNQQNPPIAASQTAPVAAGSAQPSASKKSPPIASSHQNGKSQPIPPAIPAMSAPAIVNGTPSDHSRKSSVTGIPNGNRPPQGLTFGAMSSPAPSAANLNPQSQSNPRVTSPAASPSPIPQYSGGKPNKVPGRPEISFGGGEGAEQSNARPLSMQPQSNPLQHNTHMRRESSQNSHNFPPSGGRGRGSGYGPGGYSQMAHSSPQPYRPLPNQTRGGGPNMAFQSPMPQSPYVKNRSPVVNPAQLQQQQFNGPGMPYYQHNYQPNPYGMPQPSMDPYSQYYGQPGYGLQQSIHYPGVPASPGRGHAFPQQMQGHYNMPGPYGPPPQAPGMSRTPSNMSERPPSAVAQPSTPAMTNVNHASHTHTPSVGTSSPGPNSANFAIPPKKASKAIPIKKPDGELVNFEKKSTSPAPPAQPAPPAPPSLPVQPRSPAIAATPTPPPRPESTHSRTESTTTQTVEEKRAEFVRKFQSNLEANKEKEQQEAKAKAQKEKEDAETKVQKEKEDAETKAQMEKEAAEAKAAKEKEEAEEAAREKEEADKAAKEKEEAEAQRLKEEEEERLIAEMEAMEREEEERERKFQEKRRLEAEAKAARAAEEAKAEDERLRAQEREAEAAEEARSKETPEQKAEREALFASLKKNTQFGPGAMGGAMGATDSGASTPTAETPTQSQPPSKPNSGKPKPAALKLETNKSIEPPQPTPGMQALRSSRLLDIKRDAVIYPEGIQSPNPALNLGSRRGRQYDKDFLLQFQGVFKEKPSIDWDMKLKETVGDSSDSAVPKSARPSSMMGGRQPSRGPLQNVGTMGSFGAFGANPPGGRTLPPGTTSEQRFHATNQGRPAMQNPIAPFIGGKGSFMGGPMAPPMARSSSFQNMAPGSPRVGSSRGGRGSRRGDNKSKKEDEKANAAMPLTASLDASKLVLERSTTGWKPHSASQGAAAPAASGHMAPDMVQRKVKAALNKMTPEKFDRISAQILEIAAQSREESDGRTLRQVIQLTFEKACDEAHWASMYAKFCFRMLQEMSTDIKDENVTDKTGKPVVGGNLFRKYLLNRCQEEFERGWQIDLPEKPEGQTEEAAMLSDEYYVAAAAKRRGLGLIQFIGELYKLGMLTLRIMHECVLKLLDFEGLPDESAIESLVKLLRTVGATMESTDTGPKMIAVYFERIGKITDMEGLPSRLRFMLMDILDLRRAHWRSKDDAKGPKTIAEIHQEAAAAHQAAEMERMRSNQRTGPRPPLGRGDARSFSSGVPPPQDFQSRVQMDDLRKLSKNATNRNPNAPSALGPSMLGSRSNSGRRGLGLGPGGLIGRSDESGTSSRTATPPTQKDKESTTHVNSFSALAALENEGAGEVGSPPSTASSPPVQKAAPVAEAKEAKPSE